MQPDTGQDPIKKSRTVHLARQYAAATELPFVLVVPVVVGGLIGYWLDFRLGTQPFVTVGMGAIGLYAGVRELLRRLAKMNQGKDGGSSH